MGRKKIKNIEMLGEVSLNKEPKNKRKFLGIKGEVEVPGQTVVSPVDLLDSPDAIMKAAAGMPVDITSPTPEPPPVTMAMEPAEEPAVEAVAEPTVEAIEDEEDTSEEDLVEMSDQPEQSDPAAVASALQTMAMLIHRSLIPPKEVVEACRSILTMANIDPNVEVVKSLDETNQVLVTSLVGMVPPDFSDDAVKAVEVIKAWWDGGFPLNEAVSEAPVMAAPVARRVVRATELIDAGERTAASFLEGGAQELYSEMMKFCRSVRKALPDGGLVVISGTVPEDSPDTVYLNNVWSTPKPDVNMAVQAVIDSLSVNHSQAAEIRSLTEATISEFSDVLLDAVSSDRTYDDKAQVVQMAFNKIGQEIKGILERTRPETKEDPEKIELMSRLDAMTIEIQKLKENATKPPMLAFSAPAPAPQKENVIRPVDPPVRRSIPASIMTGNRQNTPRRPMAISDIVARSSALR